MLNSARASRSTDDETTSSVSTSASSSNMSSSIWSSISASSDEIVRVLSSTNGSSLDTSYSSPQSSSFPTSQLSSSSSAVSYLSQVLGGSEDGQVVEDKYYGEINNHNTNAMFLLRAKLVKAQSAFGKSRVNTKITDNQKKKNCTMHTMINASFFSTKYCLNKRLKLF